MDANGADLIPDDSPVVRFGQPERRGGHNVLAGRIGDAGAVRGNIGMKAVQEAMGSSGSPAPWIRIDDSLQESSFNIHCPDGVLIVKNEASAVRRPIYEVMVWVFSPEERPTGEYDSINYCCLYQC